MRTYSSIGVEKYITLGFLSLILAGTLLLWATGRIAGMPVRALDALFLATSSVCVTGLATVDIGRELALSSQVTMLILIQLGGIGIMAVTTTLMLVAGHRLALRERLYLAGGFGSDSPSGVVRLLKLVLAYTIILEAAGALMLFAAFSKSGLLPPQAVYNAVFHSVSAYCNAGFSTFSTNLEGYAQSLLLPATIMALIVAGGIGFPVMFELHEYRLKRRSFLSPYVKTVLLATALLLALGTVLIAAFEWNRAFSGLPAWAKAWNALFGSVTARTAGFDTVHYAKWSAEGLLVTILLMLVGASPSSTGGGLKTTTFAVLLWSAWTELRQEEEVNLWGRCIPYTTIRRALALAFIYLFTLLFATAALSINENQPFSALAFEAVSALGTVGLSQGITPRLSGTSKMVLILLMFWGRVGLLTFSYCIVPRERPVDVHLPDANIPIG